MWHNPPVYKVKARKGTACWQSRIVNKQDPTDLTLIQIMRADGVEFEIEFFWDTAKLSIHGQPKLVTSDSVEIDAWIRKHSLPSMEHIEREVRKQKEKENEDPYGPLSRYI